MRVEEGDGPEVCGAKDKDEGRNQLEEHVDAGPAPHPGIPPLAEGPREGLKGPAPPPLPLVDEIPHRVGWLAPHARREHANPRAVGGEPDRHVDILRERCNAPWA